MSLNFSLKWNSHYSVFLEFLTSLHGKNRFSDATIACNGKLYPVHQFVLSVCSNYFNAIFEGFAGDSLGSQRHPVLILSDVASSTLEDLLCYMYLGEVTVEQGRVTELLMVAKSLQVKGLSVMDKGSTQGVTHQNTTKNSNQEKVTSDCTGDAPGIAETGSGSNQDLCYAPISLETNLNQFPTTEVTEHCHPLLLQDQPIDEELLSRKPCDGRDRRCKQVGKRVRRLNGFHDDCNPGIAPPAAKKHCFDQPATDATASTYPITQAFCPNLSDPAVTIKLEPGVETMQTLGDRVVDPTPAQPGGAIDFLAPMDSTTRDSPQSLVDSNPCATLHSPESNNLNLCCGANSGEFSRENHITSGDATGSSYVGCIPGLQLKTEATDDELNNLANVEPSSCGSHTSMPVITDCYSLLELETSGIHPGHIGDAWMSQPRKTPTALPFFLFNSSANDLMQDTSLGENEDRSGLLPTELPDSLFPSNFENDSEFQALKWTVPTSMTCQNRSDHTKHDEKSATENCIPKRRKRVFRCSLCSYMTRRKRFFLRHQLHLCPHRPRVRQKWRPLASNGFDCKFCEFSTSNGSNLKKHLLMHSKKKLLQCPLCSYSTDKDYFLQAHINKDHGSQSRSSNELLLTNSPGKDKPEENKDTQSNPLPTKENYLCEHCHCCFQKKNCLLEHKRIHGEPDNVKCPDCDYRTFRNFFNMKKHTSLPSRGSFKCDFCSYTACTEHLIAKHAKLDQLKLSPRKPLKTEPVSVSCSCNDADGVAFGTNDNANDYCCC